MKSLEQFKNEITEEGKEEFLAYMKEQTAKGKPSAEAVAEYIRSKGYDVTDADMQPLNDDDLEDVAGGKLGDPATAAIIISYILVSKRMTAIASSGRHIISRKNAQSVGKFGGKR